MGLNLKDIIQKLGHRERTKRPFDGATNSYDRSSFLRPHRTVDVRGYVFEFLTAQPSGFEDQVILKAILPPGVCTPRQSQTEPQMLLILSGRLEALVSNVWRTWSEGEALEIGRNQKHALRNLHGQKVVAVLVTTPAMVRFLEDAGRRVNPGASVTPPVEDWNRYVQAVRRHGHWVEDTDIAG